MTDLVPIGIQMVGSGLDWRFVNRVVALALQGNGADSLVEMGAEATSQEDRDAVVADLYELLEDVASPADHGVEQRDTEALLSDRQREKAHLRALIEAHGGVSAVARAASIPQPSLSRMLASLSEPRPATLRKLAVAMNLDLAALQPPGITSGHGEVVYLPGYDPTSSAWAPVAAARR